MTPQEAEKWSVHEIERRSYYRFDEGKPNLKKPGGFSKWMKMESVTLDSREEVGVPESWTPPRTAEADPTADSIIAEANAPLEPLTDTDLAVLSRIEARIMKRLPVVCGSRSDDSAPKLFSKGVQGGKQRRMRAEAVEAGVDRLIAHGKLHVDQGWSSGHARGSNCSSDRVEQPPRNATQTRRCHGRRGPRRRQKPPSQPPKKV
jgi:hypothetical protein